MRARQLFPRRWLRPGYSAVPTQPHDDDDDDAEDGDRRARCRVHRPAVACCVLCALGLGQLLLLGAYASAEEARFIFAQHAAHTRHMAAGVPPAARLCSGSPWDTQGSWERVPSARARHRHPIYDQVPWNVCGHAALFAAAEERYVRSNGCHTLDLLDGLDALGGRTLHLVGDSLARYSYTSLRWARRRTLLQSLLCGNRAPGTEPVSSAAKSGGLARQVWTALRGSQGMEGDFRIHVGWIEWMRTWLDWEGDRNVREVSNGVSYTAFAHSWCGEHWPADGAENVDFPRLFELFFRPNATEPSDEVLLLNFGHWYNLGTLQTVTLRMSRCAHGALMPSARVQRSLLMLRKSEPTPNSCSKPSPRAAQVRILMFLFVPT